jgi:hypothetical protein
VGISKIQRLGGTRMMSLAEAIDCEHESRLLKKGFCFWLGRDSVRIRNGAAGCAELTNGRERYSITSTLKREFEPTIRCA